MARSLIAMQKFRRNLCGYSVRGVWAALFVGPYKSARAGQISNMLGIKSPYERPVNPQFVVGPDTDMYSVDAELTRLVVASG